MSSQIEKFCVHLPHRRRREIGMELQFCSSGNNNSMHVHTHVIVLQPSSSSSSCVNSFNLLISHLFAFIVCLCHKFLNASSFSSLSLLLIFFCARTQKPNSEWQRGRGRKFKRRKILYEITRVSLDTQLPSENESSESSFLCVSITNNVVYIE